MQIKSKFCFTFFYWLNITAIIQIKDYNSPITIEIDKDNNIVGYNNQKLKRVGDNFLIRNKQLSELNLPQLTKVGSFYLEHNKQLRELNLPQLTEVEYYFLTMHPRRKRIIERIKNLFRINYNKQK